VGISFLKAAKPYLIPLNGNLALELIPGQSHKRPAAATVVFFACKASLNTSQGAFDNSGQSQDCSLQKRDPHGLPRLGRAFPDSVGPYHDSVGNDGSLKLSG
jgi:hypothetical protein